MSEPTATGKDCRNSGSFGAPVVVSRETARWSLDAFKRARAAGGYDGMPSETGQTLAIVLAELEEAAR